MWGLPMLLVQVPAHFQLLNVVQVHLLTNADSQAHKGACKTIQTHTRVLSAAAATHS